MLRQCWLDRSNNFGKKKEQKKKKRKNNLYNRNIRMKNVYNCSPPAWWPKLSSISGNRPFALSGHMVRTKLCWDPNSAMGLSKQRKVRLGWTGKSSFVLEVPLSYLCTSIINSIPCVQIMQRAYCPIHPQKMVRPLLQFMLSLWSWKDTANLLPSLVAHIV